MTISEEPLKEHTPELKRHQLYINKCNEVARKRWETGVLAIPLRNAQFDVICVVKLQKPKSQVEQPIQYLYLLKLHRNMEKRNPRNLM